MNPTCFRLGSIAAISLAMDSARTEEPSSAWLQWRNGDELKGEILDSPDGRIQWQSPLFSRALTLETPALERIRFPSTNETIDPDQLSRFRINLINGNRIQGGVLEIKATSVVVKCHAFEQPIEIARNQIESILHTTGDRFHFAGPRELSNWSSSGRDRETTEWFVDLKGAFATHQWSGNLFKAVEFPRRVEIQFEAEFPKGHPNLEIGLTQLPSLGPTVETWDDSLVLAFGSDFVPIMELHEGTQEIRLRLLWNQDSGEFHVCDPSGRLLASLENVKVGRPRAEEVATLIDAVDADHKEARKPVEPIDETSLKRGFSILNRTPELRLNSVIISEWEGSLPPVIDLDQPRIILADADPLLNVQNLRLSRGADAISVGGRSVPLDQVQEFVLTPKVDSDDGEKNLTRETSVLWFEGTSISGEFHKINRYHVLLNPSWSATPIPLLLASAKEVRFPGDSIAFPPAAEHLSGEGLSLHGTTRPITDRKETDSFLGWLPPGATKPVPFAEGQKVKVTRPGHAAVTANLAANIGQARVFLTNNEIITGELISIEARAIHFTSRVTGQLKIPSSRIKAIDIGSAGRVLDGFNDQEWEEIEEVDEQVTLTRESATLRGGGFGNSSLLLGDLIEFDAEWANASGAFTIKLFTDGPDSTNPSTNVIIAAQGNRLFVGKLKDSGAFSFSGDQIPISDHRASIKIEARPEKVEVFVNEKSTLTLPVSPEGVSGNGVYFMMGGGWQGWNQAESEIQFSQFRVSRTPGSVPRRIIDPNAKEKALTIPRIHRDTSPTHVLIAPNGDLLRGELLSASGNQFRFSSKGATFEIPRHRISAVVWLIDPEADPDDQGSPEVDEFQATHQFVLMDGSRLKLMADRIDGDQFIGSSEYLGECRVTRTNIREMHRGPAEPVRNLTLTDIPVFDHWNLKYTVDPSIPG
ncbi:MAG: hypothetical protein AAGA96_20350, partial [Verrucomicrobiota bacterium]